MSAQSSLTLTWMSAKALLLGAALAGLAAGGVGCSPRPARSPTQAQVRDFLAQHDPVTRNLELSIVKVSPASADGSEVRVNYRLRSPEPAVEEALLPVPYLDEVALRGEPKLVEELSNLARHALEASEGLSSLARRGEPTLQRLDQCLEAAFPARPKPVPGQREGPPPAPPSREARVDRLARGPEPEAIFYEDQVKAGEHGTLDQSVKAGEIAPGQWRFYPETVAPPARRLAWRQRWDLGEKRPILRADSTEAKAALDTHLRDWRDLLAAVSTRAAALRAGTEARLALEPRLLVGIWELPSSGDWRQPVSLWFLVNQVAAAEFITPVGGDPLAKGSWDYEPASHRLNLHLGAYPAAALPAADLDLLLLDVNEEEEELRFPNGNRVVLTRKKLPK